MKFDCAARSYDELLDVRQRINREKYPETYAEVIAEIERRKQSGEFKVEQAQKQRDQRALPLRWVSTVCVVMGIWFSYSLVLEPVRFTFAAARWPSVPCVIVYQQPNHSGPSEIRYRYSFEGRTYLGERLSSSQAVRKPSSWKREFYQGKRTFCRVNSTNPRQATLTWGPDWTIMLNLMPPVVLFFLARGAWREIADAESQARKDGN